VALERAAEILFLSKNFQKAATYFDFLSQLEPENPEYLKTSADLALMTNNIDKAIGIYKKLLVLLPEDQQIRDNLGEIMSQVKSEKHDSLKYLKGRIAENPDNITNYKNLAFYYLNNGQTDSARAVLVEGSQKFPENPDFYFILGSVCRERGETDTALEYLEKSLQFAEDSLQIMQLQATLYEERGEYAISDSLYNILITKYPDDPVALNNFAYSLASRNKELDQALKMVDKALEIHPDNASYLDTKGWILYNQEKYKEAEVFLQKAYEVFGDNFEILEHLGDLKTKQNKIEKAQEYYEKALELDPENETIKQKINSTK
jgi:tetratricopeptide (TPR) repeat protein